MKKRFLVTVLWFSVVDFPLPDVDGKELNIKPFDMAREEFPSEEDIIETAVRYHQADLGTCKVVAVSEVPETFRDFKKELPITPKGSEES